jgi:drug/metabolite transporter (DMT)-like permease
MLPPLAMAFWRWAVALVVLAPFALGPMLRERDTIRRHWKILIVLGVLGVGSFNTLAYIGLGSTTATNGLLLNSSIPVLIVALGWMFFAEPATPRQGLGVAVSLCGVLAIIAKGDLGQLLALRLNPGDLWVFSAMVSWAFYTLLLRRRPAKLSSIAFMGITVLIGLLANLPLYLGELAYGAHAKLNAASLGAIAYLGVFPSVLAYLFWNKAVREVGANRAGLFSHLMPVFGSLLAFLFLGESLRGYHLVGFALILGGILLANVSAPAPEN